MTAKCLLKAEALGRGDTRYTSSTPCSKGHGFERLVATGGCAECAKGHRRAAYQRNPQQRIQAREDMRARRAADPIGVRRKQTVSRLLRDYGLTEAQYTAMFVAQKGRCLICPEQLISRLDDSRPFGKGTGRAINAVSRVDHCHSTSVVRGLLCSDCNIGLGKFRDSETILLNAVRYLRESATAQAQPAAERESVSEIAPGDRDRESSVCRGNRRDELSPFFN